MGEAGSISVSGNGEPLMYVTGALRLDGQQFAEILSRPGGAAAGQAVIEHELAHLVGLDHVSDPTQLMYPETTPEVLTYAAGDLTGLAQLGRGRCAPEL